MQPFLVTQSTSGSAHETRPIFYSTCQLPPAFIHSLLCYFACSHFNTKRQVKNIVKSGPFSMSAFIIQLPVRFPRSYEALKRLGSGQQSSPQFCELVGQLARHLPPSRREGPSPGHRHRKPSWITTVWNFCSISKRPHANSRWVSRPAFKNVTKNSDPKT